MELSPIFSSMELFFSPAAKCRFAQFLSKKTFFCKKVFFLAKKCGTMVISKTSEV